MGAADRTDARLRQAPMPDLARRDQLADRTGGVLDRHQWVDAVLVEDVDPVGPQPPEAGIGDGLYVLGPAVGASAALAGLKIDVEAELGRDHDLSADRLQCLADQLLVDEG